MSESDHERRVSKRNEVSLPAVVKGRDSAVKHWKEQTSLVTVSRLGASFNMSRQFRAGRILSLITNMPKALRCYDEDKKLYRVWGLVQHCSPVFGSEGSEFQIGIAFIGKFAPKSYVDDPLKSYRIIGMDEDGFWNIGESKTPFITRAHHRFPCRLEVRLTRIDADGKETGDQVDAVTDNISNGGALVFSSLDVSGGDALRFTCEKYGYSSIAVVRNRQEREGNRTTLHLQFMESNFPVKDIELPYLGDPEIDASDELGIIDGEEDSIETSPASTDETDGTESFTIESSSGEEKTFEDEASDEDEEFDDETEDDADLELDLDDPQDRTGESAEEFSLDIDSEDEQEDVEESDDDAPSDEESDEEPDDVEDTASSDEDSDEENDDAEDDDAEDDDAEDDDAEDDDAEDDDAEDDDAEDDDAEDDDAEDDDAEDVLNEDGEEE